MNNIKTDVKELIVIIGASMDPSRYSYMAAHRLVQAGYSIVNVGLKNGEVAGKEITHQLDPALNPHTITLYINPSIQSNYVDAIMAANPKRVIFNPGTENPSIYPLLESKGIFCEEACTLVLLSTGRF